MDYYETFKLMVKLAIVRNTLTLTLSGLTRSLVKNTLLHDTIAETI
jgi:hypothetical protein